MKITPLPQEIQPIGLGTTLADGDVLTWDTTTGTWVAGPAITDHGLLTGLADDDHPAYVKVVEGGQDTIMAHGNMGATETFDPSLGNVHTATADADCTITLGAPVGSGACMLELHITQDATGGRALTWPGTVVWPDGLAPVPDTTAGSVTRYVLETLDGGTTWYGVMVGAGLSAADFATPAIVLGTAAAAGVAGTVIRSDATVVAFDATVPVTQAFGDAAATGDAAVAARRNHRHGMPATPTVPIVGDQHVHVVDEQYSGDATATVFIIANTAAADSVMAWVSGTRTPVTLGGTSFDEITFGSAPAAGTNNISVDYAAVLAV